jgi:murein DD-endopeptidase MepM/ murein hydrolase activator NlpD
MRTPLTLAAVALVAVTGAAQKEPSFAFPRDGSLRGLKGSGKGKGSFGVPIKRRGSPFTHSYYLAEDVWLPGGTTVRSIGDGVVRYSHFRPTWKDKRGRIHWNLGNVIVIEHALDPAEKDLEAICPVYVTKEAVAEWLRPGVWLTEHGAR